MTEISEEIAQESESEGFGLPPRGGLGGFLRLWGQPPPSTLVALAACRQLSPHPPPEQTAPPCIFLTK